ncbi:MAG TPA: PHB depolymerase family esterase [Pseudoduganella sp.]
MIARPTRCTRSTRSTFALALLFQLNLAHADDGKGLRRGADPGEVSISGVSAGAAMALQYAVAHSASITGVGAIAGPPWGCAEGRLAQSINSCMCGRQAIAPKAVAARELARRGGIDPLVAGKPRALKRAYVFQSAADHTVVKQAGMASIDFLTDFIGAAPVVDFGDAATGSNAAQHGIVSPEGPDKCGIERDTDIYIRQCGAEDNAGKLLLALHAPGKRYDARLRQAGIPASEIWEFSQQPMIDAVRSSRALIAADRPIGPDFVSPRRASLDMADKGYLYVPPACRQPGSHCGVHVALHGCRQDARQFATLSGYNNWAGHYRIVVVYPAIKADPHPIRGSVCAMPVVQEIANNALFEPNPNGCWDWWGYLDNGWPEQQRYVSRNAPQMQVIERIVAEVTAPLAGTGAPGSGQP